MTTVIGVRASCRLEELGRPPIGSVWEHFLVAEKLCPYDQLDMGAVGEWGDSRTEATVMPPSKKIWEQVSVESQ